VPVRNGENFLEFALSSVFAQTHKAAEVVVLDDGSTDKTREICQSSRWGGALKYCFNESPTGFADAWNRAVGMASCDFVSLLHHDDTLEPDFLAAVLDASEKFPQVRHFFSPANYIDSSGQRIASGATPNGEAPRLYSGQQYAHEYLCGVLKRANIHRCPGVVTATVMIRDTCPFRKEAGLIADDDFFYRIGRYTDVAGLGKAYANVRVHASSETARLTSLALRLAEDYLFQVQCYAGDEGFFSKEDSSAFLGLAVGFLNQLLYESFVFARKDWTIRALELRQKLDGLVPGLVQRRLPAWAKPMWRWVMRGGSGNALAGTYAKSIHALARGLAPVRRFVTRRT
jgi:glycosyltransferase involved in cell wall biosynthesis